MGEVIPFPHPDNQLTELTPEQRQYWHDQAAYWEVRQDDAQRAVEYATRQREKALRMLGMLGLNTE